MANLFTEPPFEMPILDPATGQVSEEWYLFFVQLYRRTGSGTGGDGQLTRANVLALEETSVPVIAPQQPDYSTQTIVPYPLFAPQPDYTTDMTMPQVQQPQLRDLANDMIFAPQTLPGAMTVSVGTWTPALTFGGAAVGLTYSARSGYYWRVGQLVFFTYLITLSAVGTSTGSAAIGGLPFTSDANISNSSDIVSHAQNTAGLSGAIIGNVVASSTSISFINQAATGVLALSNSNFTSTTTIVGSGIYPIGAIS